MPLHLKMDLALSAIVGDLASRLFSFLMNTYADHACLEEKTERLQQLLPRVGMVMRRRTPGQITNSCMLIQLKMLAEAMYQGHHVLDTIKYRKHKELVFNLELESALQDLEAGVANMAEFVLLLGGCERISHKPYDTYLYTDNFMFGRHVEKQQIMRFLLQHDTPGSPGVLAVTGNAGVGKKKLIAHDCDDERVRSHFSMILYLNGDDLFTETDHERLPGRTLVVIEWQYGILSRPSERVGLSSERLVMAIYGLKKIGIRNENASA